MHCPVFEGKLENQLKLHFLNFLAIINSRKDLIKIQAASRRSRKRQNKLGKVYNISLCYGKGEHNLLVYHKISKYNIGLTQRPDSQHLSVLVKRLSSQ